MDLITVATLAYFGAMLAGGLVGVLVGHFSRFELGLGVGLLIPGIVALWFSWNCLADYRAFAEAGPNSVYGEVIEIENRPVNESGDITTPVPVVRFTAPDRTSHTVRGPSASGFKPGEQVSVIYEPSAPERSRVGKPSQLRGGAIAMMLFGTFPLTIGLWFVHAYALGSGDERKSLAERAVSIPVSPLRARMLDATLIALKLLTLGAILWIGVPGELTQGFVEGFSLVAAAMVGYAIWGTFDPRVNSSWCFGMLVLAVNFGVWAFALHLLT